MSIYLWLLHRLSGFILIFLLLFHLLYFHLFDAPLDYSEIINRIDKPLWKLFYFIFLITSIYHGTYGMHVIVTEYFSNSSIYKLLRAGLYLLAIGMLWIGLNFLLL